MLKHILKFLSVILITLMCCGGVYANATSNVNADETPGFVLGDVEEYGSWATPSNRELVIDAINTEIDNFAPQEQLVDDFVPIEARIGIAFINAMSHVANILDSSLGRFAFYFIIIMYIFWIMGEGYNNIQTGWDVKKLAKDLIIKTLKVIFWLTVLIYGPVELFLLVITPIVTIGSYTADAILNAVANVVNIQLPDTCTAIHLHAAEKMSTSAIISADAAADIICLPTRLSGFFASGVALGWQCIKQSIGNSFALFILGLVFIWLFISNAWKFLFMAFGVIADLILAMIMLPFTAIAETVSKTSYKGIAGNIYNGFTDLFKAESLKEQINRVISATIYFLVLSVVIAVCAALMSGVINLNDNSLVANIENSNFIPLLITGCLVYHLASKADEIAKEWGGSVRDEYGAKMRESIKGWGKGAWKGIKDFRKAFKKDD